MTEFGLLISGQLVAGDSEIEVINPATEQVLARCPRASVGQLNEAVAAAKAASAAWSATPIADRRRVVRQFAAIVEANAAELARLLTQEQGKPLAQAMADITRTVAYFRYFAEQSYPDRSLESGGARRIELRHRPLGVVAAIVPWNAPLTLLGFKIPAALLGGNTVVLKPAATTPLTTLRLAALVKHVAPPGVFNVIADANDLGGELARHTDVRMVSFTGSTDTGMQVMAGAATTLKRLTLELGGNDAAIVLADVDPAEVAAKIFASAFRNAGQICVAIKRVYADQAIYESLCDNLTRIAEATIVGDGLEAGVEMGPLQNRAQFEKVLNIIGVARRDGRVVAGGVRAGTRGYFIRPTIVRDIVDGAQLVDEEQFGPVLPIIKIKDAEDGLLRANSSPYGLGGSVWSSDLVRAYALADRLQAGTVWINHHGELLPNVPFCGAKRSGLGAELGEDALLDFTQRQVINAAG